METDEKKQQIEDIGIHNEYAKAYIKILKTYNKHIRSTIEKKNELKQKFFKTIKFIMCALTILFGCSLICSLFIFVLMIKYEYQSAAVITGAITALISSFVTMTLSIFKLPEIIAEYLFNKNEDVLMSEIIKNIQNHEIDMVKTAKKADVDAAKDQKIKNHDDSFSENPNKAKNKPTDIRDSMEK